MRLSGGRLISLLRQSPDDVSRGSPRLGRPVRPRRARGDVVSAALLTLALTLAGAASAAEMPVSEPPPPAYLGSAVYADCHAGAAAAWSGSDHANAWTLPSETTVLGDFDDAVYTHGGQTTRFFRDGEGWFIETEGPDGQRRPYVVVGVAGIDPLQQYLLSPEPGRTQAYDIAWDVKGRRWYPVFPGDPPPLRRRFPLDRPLQELGGPLRRVPCHRLYPELRSGHSALRSGTRGNRRRLRGLPWARRRACRLGTGWRRARARTDTARTDRRSRPLGTGRGRTMCHLPCPARGLRRRQPAPRHAAPRRVQRRTPAPGRLRPRRGHPRRELRIRFIHAIEDGGRRRAMLELP